MTLERFEIDPTHSVVEFLIRHLVVSKVRGRFERFHGSILLDEDDLSASSAEACVLTASVDTREPQRDQHLRSADFFDAERFPEMCFTSTSVRTREDGRLAVAGDLSIHGVTREVVLVGTYGGRARDLDGEERVGFEATATVDRRDYGLVWNAALESGGLLVGDTVEIDLEIEAIKTSRPAAASLRGS